MEVAIHFIFEIIKISLLAAIYATVIVLSYSVLNKSRSKISIRKITKEKKLVWFLSGFIISIALFLYMFTFWGNHGLGDSARIPIGNSLAIENINWNDYGYVNGLQSSQDDKLRTTRFRITNEALVGNLCQYESNCPNGYFCYLFDNNELIEFGNEKEYSEFAARKELPAISELLSFEENYRLYWSGWRFWLLP